MTQELLPQVLSADCVPTTATERIALHQSNAITVVVPTFTLEISENVPPPYGMAVQNSGPLYETEPLLREPTVMARATHGASTCFGHSASCNWHFANSSQRTVRGVNSNSGLRFQLSDERQVVCLDTRNGRSPTRVRRTSSFATSNMGSRPCLGRAQYPPMWILSRT